MTTQEIMALADDYVSMKRYLAESPRARERLQSAIEALQADARRYRWLRNDLYKNDVVIDEALIRFEVIGACPTEQQFDAAIDAAMALDKR
jgi:hypothetical protein